MNKPNGVDWNAVFHELHESILSLERIAEHNNNSIKQLLQIVESHESRISRLEEGRGGKAQ